MKGKRAVCRPPNIFNITKCGAACQSLSVPFYSILRFIRIKVVKIIQYYILNGREICAILQSQREKPIKKAKPSKARHRMQKQDVKSNMTAAFKIT